MCVRVKGGGEMLLMSHSMNARVMIYHTAGTTAQLHELNLKSRKAKSESLRGKKTANKKNIWEKKLY